jgi:uncharacterized membrane protein
VTGLKLALMVRDTK